MKRFVVVSVLVIQLILLIGCSNLSGKRYLVSVYNLEKGKEITLGQYFNSTELLEKRGAHYLTSPIMIEKSLPNKAQPEYIQNALGKVLMIAEFPDEARLIAYIEDPAVQAHFDKAQDFSNSELIFIAKEFNPMGMMPSQPPIGTFVNRKKPAFIMINDISMNSFIKPSTPYRIMKYMNANFPKLQVAGVKMIMPLEKVSDVRGQYPFEVLFMSEWPSERIFNEFHADKDFIKLTAETRNKAFSRFTESKANIGEIGQQND